MFSAPVASYEYFLRKVSERYGDYMSHIRSGDGHVMLVIRKKDNRDWCSSNPHIVTKEDVKRTVKDVKECLYKLPVLTDHLKLTLKEAKNHFVIDTPYIYRKSIY